MKNFPKPIDLLADLLRVEGITGEEAAIVERSATWVERMGFEPEVSEKGVVFEVAGQNPGPTLLFCTHLDTVPAGEGWTHAPFGGEREGEFLYGRGAVDARGSAVAMLFAMAHLKQRRFAQGRAIAAFSVGEEGNHPSLPKLLDRFGTIDGGVVGEPTQMHVATSQRGLMVLELHADGRQGHAARTDGPNAIYRLACDLQRLEAFEFDRVHEALGAVRLTPTRLRAGVADNVTPPKASAVLDLRSTPRYTHAELAEMIRKEVQGTLRVVDDQWIPCHTPDDARILHAAKRALSDRRFFASDAASDWAALAKREIPAVKIGPGNPVRSHQPDEWISTEELQQGIKGYEKLARAFFEPLDT